MATKTAKKPTQLKTNTQPKPKLYPEAGYSGLRRFSGYVHEDFDPMLNGFRAAAAFDEMRRNDPDVAAVLSAIEFVIHSVDWTVAPGGNTKADEDAAQFLQECMDDMDMSWHDFISDVCSMFPFGWALFEMLFKQRNGLTPYGGEQPSQFDDGRIGWAKMALRGQESLHRWEFGDHGEILGMYQRLLWSPAPVVLTPVNAPGVQAREGEYPYIPMDRCVLFRVRREKNNPEGWSILRAAYRPYYIKKNIEEIEVQGAEKDMVGTLVIRLPANASGTDRSAAQTILEDYHSGDQTGFMIPRTVNDPSLKDLDWDAFLLKSPGSKVVDTDKIINRCSVMITRTSLAQFLTLGQNRAGGSRALGTSMMDLFNISVSGHLDNIEGTINRFAVRKLFEMNSFPGMTALPQIKHSNVGDLSISDFMSSIAKLHDTGFPLDDPEAINVTRKKLGLPELDRTYLLDREERMRQLQDQAQWPESGRIVTQRRIMENVQPGTSSTGGKGAGKITLAPLDQVDSLDGVNDPKKPVAVKKTAREWAEFLAKDA